MKQIKQKASPREFDIDVVYTAQLIALDYDISAMKKRLTPEQIREAIHIARVFYCQSCG